MTMISALSVDVLIIVLSILEHHARQRRAAKSLECGPFDRGGTRRLGVAFVDAMVTLVVAPLLNAFGTGIPSYGPLGWVGIGLGQVFMGWAFGGSRWLSSARRKLEFPGFAFSRTPSLPAEGSAVRY